MLSSITNSDKRELSIHLFDMHITSVINLSDWIYIIPFGDTYLLEKSVENARKAWIEI
jgi:hypothetical protein